MNAAHIFNRTSARVAVIHVLLVLNNMSSADTIDTMGQEPYEQCGYCHEYDGNSNMDNFPILAGQQKMYLVKQLKDFRSARRVGEMQATAELLSDNDIQIVSEYFSKQTPRFPRTKGLSQDSRRLAQDLFLNGDPNRGLPACITCHGDGAAGRGDTPKIAGQHATYLRKQLQEFRQGRRQNDGGGQMRAISRQLADKEIDALAKYLAQLGSNASGS